MIELHGKHAIAKVFTDIVDEESISQVINLANQEFVIGSTIRMMPDIHVGAGCTIGTSMTIPSVMSRWTKIANGDVPSGYVISNDWR